MIAAMALTATMAIPSVMMTASAAATAGTISFTNETAGTHQYTAYRILDGTAAANGMNTQTGATLSDAAWAGTGGTKTMSDFITALQGMDSLKVDSTNPFASLTPATATVNDLMNGLSQLPANSAQAKAFAAYVVDNASDYGFPASTAGSTISESADGYYVIKESSFTAATTGETGGAQTAYLLGVYDASAGAEVTVKADAPSVIKKIAENTKTVDTAPTGAESGAKELNTNVTGQYNDVADYCFEDSIPFEIIGSIPSNIADYTTYFYEFTDTWALDEFVIVDGDSSTSANAIDKGDFAVTIDGTAVTDGFTVTPNDTNTGFKLTFADIKSGNTLTANSVVKVTYNLKFGSEANVGLPGNENTVKLTYSNNPEHKASGTPEDTHTDTPNDTVIAFTYQLDVTKYKNSAESGNEAAENEAGFKLKRTSDNKYATVTTTGTDQYKITGWVDSADNATEVKTASDGTFSFIGLDDGNYTLIETTTPSGYNTMANKTITVKATTKNVQVYKENETYNLPATVLAHVDANNDTVDVSAGTVSEDVINMPGSTLPSTGGMGTKLFIAGGGLTAVLAGVYLVSKKRTKEEDAQ